MAYSKIPRRVCYKLTTWGCGEVMGASVVKAHLGLELEEDNPFYS